MNAKPRPASAPDALNWDDLRLFLPVARLGSLTEAARVLNISISTVARRLSQLERTLGLSLFLRSQSGYALTDDGQRLLEKAAEVEGAMMGVNRLADAEASAGRVRLTLPEGLALQILLPRLDAFRTAHPTIALDIVTGPFSLDLTRRESDIALRLIKPIDNDLVARRLGTMAHGIYAATDSKTVSKLGWLPEMRRLPIAAATATWIEQNGGNTGAGAAEIAFNNLTTLAGAAAAGLGQALLPCIIGDAEPRLRRLAGPEGFFVQEVWLVFHRDLRRSPRLRPVADFLAACLAEAADRLAGKAFEKFS